MVDFKINGPEKVDLWKISCEKVDIFEEEWNHNLNYVNLAINNLDLEDNLKQKQFFLSSNNSFS